MPRPSLSRTRKRYFVYSHINFADVCRGGHGLMWTRGREGQLLSRHFGHPLWMSAMLQ